ncbi:alpha-glucan family phosphorylase [Limnoglobus roseus]|uniref:glycogen phosphorylase n=1 Tax=Limnoglobus roseus TaxID=2598579 RepID=A0A5C1AIE5_9BACT|nr:alpha-glucan family phosphorylase [Limnoglobus roseus]QEL16738.1 glycogen or starch phosphorylase [Limnoglobus roseus]
MNEPDVELPAPQAGVVAYFSMEIALESGIPTYSGGLGVLAGDTLRAAADIGYPMVGVTLAHRKGYFRQTLDDRGGQTEAADPWDPAGLLEQVPPTVTVRIEGRPVRVRAWRYWVEGLGGRLPVYLLDTNVPDNFPFDRTLTDCLYGGDDYYRLCQEVVLGLGGVALLRALNHRRITTYHMNEGHSALLSLALLREETALPTDNVAQAWGRVRRQCVFTTHTPVPAGQDRFPERLVRQLLGDADATLLLAADGLPDGELNMTGLALTCSRYVNGVALRHEEVSRGLFPDYPINAITNGVHAATWAADPFRRLYDRHVPEWRRDNLYLRYVVDVPQEEFAAAHAECKQLMLSEVERRTRVRLDVNALTLGFARRATGYKRADLVFNDLDRLRRIADAVGPLQIVFAGKAHPRDEAGKALIRRVYEAAAALRGRVAVVYLDGHDMGLVKLLCSGVDVWLNTPQKPHEASGTSGMKAALNGVPSLSVLDGWWVEGWVEGVTGWAVGDDSPTSTASAAEAESLYAKLEQAVAPLYHSRPVEFARLMRSTIALNGSFFNAQRMFVQYIGNAYIPQLAARPVRA